MAEALGMIEVKGLVGIIEAADAMAKAASVRVISYEKIGSGFTTILVRGDVASCQSAVEAGAQAAQKIGELVSCHVIAQPYPEVEDIFDVK